jgi:hypothetical protein
MVQYLTFSCSVCEVCRRHQLCRIDQKWLQKESVTSKNKDSLDIQMTLELRVGTSSSATGSVPCSSRSSVYDISEWYKSRTEDSKFVS